MKDISWHVVVVTAEYAHRFENGDDALRQYMEVEVVRTLGGEWKLGSGWFRINDVGN